MFSAQNVFRGATTACRAQNATVPAKATIASHSEMENAEKIEPVPEVQIQEVCRPQVELHEGVRRVPKIQTQTVENIVA